MVLYQLRFSKMDIYWIDLVLAGMCAGILKESLALAFTIQFWIFCTGFATFTFQPRISELSMLFVI